MTLYNVTVLVETKTVTISVWFYNKWWVMFSHFLNSVKKFPCLSYNCSNLNTVSYKGISYKTILSVPRNFLNHLRTYISTGGGKLGSQA